MQAFVNIVVNRVSPRELTAISTILRSDNCKSDIFIHIVITQAAYGY
jgi:hypothetical protein